MFRINKLTDYAVVVLVDMARNAGVRAAQQIAADTGVPLPTVAKIMKALVRGGLVISHRGAAGGYGLARPAEEISVADMIQALEGPIALTACVDQGLESCGLETLCPMRGHWNTVNGKVEAALRTVSLADMADGPADAFAEAVASRRAVTGAVGGAAVAATATAAAIENGPVFALPTALSGGAGPAAGANVPETGPGRHPGS